MNRLPTLEVIRGTPPFVAILLAITVLSIAYPPLTLALRDLAYR